MKSRQFDVTGLGNALVDVQANVDEAFITGHNMAKGSMSLISAQQADALYKDMPPAKESSGGSGANTIAALASLGSRAAFIGRIGQDELGDVFAHDIRSQGVSFPAPLRDELEPTGRSFILVTPDAERTMNTSLACNTKFSPADLVPELIIDSSITYLEGYLFDQPAAKEAFIAAAKMAREAGNEVSLTLSDSFCVQRHHDDFLALLSNVDVLFANEREITALFATDDFDAAAQMARAKCKLAVLTRGSKGALVLSAQGVAEIEAEKVAQVVDLTGAGDAFAAGFLHGYTQGLSLAESGRLGALAASEIIGHYGARPEVRLSDFVASRKAA